MNCIFTINKETGEEIEIGKCIGELEVTPKEEFYYIPISIKEPSGEIECACELKTITKKKIY